MSTYNHDDCGEAPKKGLLIVLDVTGSMDGSIKRLPKFLVDFVIREYELLSGEIGLVTFDEYPNAKIRSYGIFENLEHLAFELLQIDTGNGDDTAECIVEGLIAGDALMSTTGNDYITWLVTDAYPHARPGDWGYKTEYEYEYDIDDNLYRGNVSIDFYKSWVDYERWDRVNLLLCPQFWYPDNDHRSRTVVQEIDIELWEIVGPNSIIFADETVMNGKIGEVNVGQYSFADR